jgi:hypothetical protein
VPHIPVLHVPQLEEPPYAYPPFPYPLLQQRRWQRCRQQRAASAVCSEATNAPPASAMSIDRLRIRFKSMILSPQRPELGEKGALGSYAPLSCSNCIWQFAFGVPYRTETDMPDKVFTVKSPDREAFDSRGLSAFHGQIRQNWLPAV